MRTLKGILALGASGLPLSAPADTANGTVEIDPENRGDRITHWGYDIKQKNRISGLGPARAEELFVQDRMNILRVGVWGEASSPAHPAAGQIDVTYYVDDGSPGSLGVYEAMRNARRVNPDVLFFASKKSDDNGMPGWTQTNGSTNSVQYARMLADYLRFWEHDLVRKEESFTFEVLGINNEGVAFSKTETLKHPEIVTELRRLSQLTGTVDLVDNTHATDPVVTVPAAFTMPLVIGPETFNPEPDEVDDILDRPNGPESLDIIGCHYYPFNRPFGNLQSMVNKGLGRPSWHSEVHWNGQGSNTLLEQGELTLLTIFDCISVGMTGYSWWSYDNGAAFRPQLEQAITTSTIHSTPVAIDDPIGSLDNEIPGTLVTRAFLQGDTLNVWMLNVTAQARNDFDFRLLNGEIAGPVAYRQWLDDGGTFRQDTGVATVTTPRTFTASVPAQSIALFSLPYRASELQARYRLEGDAIDASRHGNHGTLSGAPSFGPGRLDDALLLNGVDASVTIPKPVDEDFSIAFWVRPDGPSVISGGGTQWYQGAGLVDGEIAGVTSDFGVSLLGDRIAFGVGAPDTTLLSGPIATNGGWTHVAATRSSDSGGMRLFINGNLAAETTGPTGPRLAASELSIGSLLPGNAFVAGAIDEVRISSKVLGKGEILQLSRLAGPGAVVFHEDFEDESVGDNPALGGANIGGSYLFESGSADVRTNPESFGNVSARVLRGGNVASNSNAWTGFFGRAVEIDGMHLEFDFYSGADGSDDGDSVRVALVGSGGGERSTFIRNDRDGLIRLSGEDQTVTNFGPDAWQRFRGTFQAVAPGDYLLDWQLTNLETNETRGGTLPVDLTSSSFPDATRAEGVFLEIFDPSDADDYLGYLDNVTVTIPEPDGEALLTDSFERPDSTETGRSGAGTRGTFGPATYVEVELEPADTQVRAGRVYLAHRNGGASVLGLPSQNFVGPEILAAGGFRVSMEIADLGTLTDPDRFCGFGVGLSAEELAALDFDFGSANGPRGRFDGSVGGTADFYLDWTPNGGGAVQWFKESSTGGTQLTVPAPTGGVLSAEFRFDHFATGAPVDVTIFFNGVELASDSFAWSDSSANYLALSARQENGMAVDNLVIRPLSNALFADSFTRDDSTDLDASPSGMSGRHAPITYLEVEATDELTQVLSGGLHMAYGSNSSVVGLDHNFIDADILENGGFSVAMDINDLGTATDTDRWCGFGVGLTAAELSALAQDFNSSSGPCGRFDGSTPGVADCFVAWSPNDDGSIQLFQQATIGGTQTSVEAPTGGRLRAEFRCTSFTAGAPVEVTVFLDDLEVAQSVFNWSATDANFIALSCRQSDGMILDKLAIAPLPATDPYVVWAESFGLVGDPGDDDDLDGVINRHEYELVSDPLDPADRGQPTQLTRLDNEGELRATYLRRTDDPTLGYVFETSDDLDDWQPSSFTIVSSTDVAPGIREIVIAIPLGNDMRFVRQRSQP